MTFATLCARHRYLGRNYFAAIKARLLFGPGVSRRRPKKATTAVLASILTAIYHMLKDGTMYNKLGFNCFERRSTDQQKNRPIKRLADLGCAIETIAELLDWTASTSDPLNVSY